MTIGQLAQAAGVKPVTLRFYERRGLLREPVRTGSGHRRYDGEALRRVQLIRRAQVLGFSLAEVAELIEAVGDPDAVCEDICATVEAKVDHLDDLLARLQDQRRRLAQLRDACPRSRPLRECPVVEELSKQPPSKRGRSHEETSRRGDCGFTRPRGRSDRLGDSSMRSNRR